ncbi:uncharacterized protein EAF02_009157 [Botrytis sinoallii]|uniref:uncharacterized protein n=1 Tax=Botrytis sinoallii TaxID=1463999 RepID=UPI0019018446|nr:uncharacterized protein EAF02_009157 [Botrytis sinoallii]KAF7872052.1 hypothetical protein EAF02_009157 [Botrytis sinoallii]
MSLTDRLQTYEYSIKTAVSAELHDLNDPDATYLARIGKQQVTKRNFGLVSMIGLACTLMSTWEGVLIVFALGYEKLGKV